MPQTAAELLTDLVCARKDPGIRIWLADVGARATEGQREALYSAYTAAVRKAGRELLKLSASEQAQWTRLLDETEPDGWTCDDALRAALLLSTGEVIGPDDLFVIAIECYERGDSREQQSWLKALPLLPNAERFLSVAIDACRTNIAPQFESIACGNPYPARHFPETNFNQLVLKAMFVGVPLARIVGLEGRLNPELARMARDYAAERRAAGRTVPADLPLALTREALAEEQLR
jgi:hypothetical protein